MCIMVAVNYFTCDKSTNVNRMVTVNYFTCNKSINVHRMVTVNYLTVINLQMCIEWYL